MSFQVNSVPVFDYLDNAPPYLVGDLGATGLTAFIRLWKAGSQVTLASSGCPEIGNTGHYAFSTANIPGSSISEPRNQYHYQIVAQSGLSFDGDFILATQNPIRHPRWAQNASFLRNI